jgi:hypothetical protein
MGERELARKETAIVSQLEKEQTTQNTPAPPGWIDGNQEQR